VLTLFWLEKVRRLHSSRSSVFTNLGFEAAYETILGLQEGGVQACAKHFINKYGPELD
jgi:hypothetical protein